MKPKISLSDDDILSLHTAKEILDKDPHITIGNLATKVGLNRKKLTYGFKKLFGQTINDYEIQVKMDKAKELLQNTTKQIKQIAIKSGYDNINSFSTAFKKAFGISPSEWRDENSILTTIYFTILFTPFSL